MGVQLGILDRMIPTMRKLLVAVGLLAVLTASAACGGSDDVDTGAAPTGPQETTILDIHTDYQLSRQEANTKWRDQVVVLTGTVRRTGEGTVSATETEERPLVALQGAEGAGADCYFDLEKKEEVDALSTGQTVTVQGRVYWADRESVVLDECLITGVQ